MERLGFGFVGAGEIAVDSAGAVSRTTNASLVTTFDVRTDLAKDLSERFGGRPARSLDDLLADEAARAVYVCVPHYLHWDIALQVARAGKHLFMEKPMGVSPDDAQAIVWACQDAAVACGVAFVVRYAPAYRAARDLVASGAIGEVTGFRITYRCDKPASYWTGGWSGRAIGDWRTSWETAGGGVLLMNTIHDLDAVCWISGLRVERVIAAISTTGGRSEVEDAGVVIGWCAGGAIGSVEGLASLPGGTGPDERWVNRIYGTRGQILLPTPWGEEALAVFTRDRGTWSEIDASGGPEARTLAFEDFADAVLGGRRPPIPGEDGVLASRVVHAAYRSARARMPVDVEG